MTEGENQIIHAARQFLRVMKDHTAGDWNTAKMFAAAACVGRAVELDPGLAEEMPPDLRRVFEAGAKRRAGNAAQREVKARDGRE
jgi:hypothetical protein